MAMKFSHMTKWWWTPNFGTNDISFGLHICWKGRVDIHIWKGMLSLGHVPIYKIQTNNGVKNIAVSNSFHDSTVERKRKMPIRACTQEDV